MRIGIDAHILGKQKGGVETCIEALILQLARIDSENRYFIYVSPGHKFLEAGLPSNFQVSPLAASSPWIERSLLIPYLYCRDGLDVIHLQRAMPLLGCPNTVLHVHDAIYMTHPHLIPGWKRMILNPLFRYSGWRAKAVVTTTETSRADIVKYYGVAPGKITIVANGVNTASFFPVRDDPGSAARQLTYGLSAPYVIYLGAMERNKQVHILIDGFARFLKRFPDYQLALVGKFRSETRGGYTEELLQQVRRLNLGDRVVFTGYVPDDDRRFLLSGASMLVFPSTAEGFGLPPLEAMACGTPAIACSISVIEEVYGDSVLTFRGGDVDHLAEQMMRLALSPEFRKSLRERGFRKVAEFSWETHARKMLEIYQRFGRSSVN